mmetsp:Transcript_40046/g.105880  ORF Transcript_40046/g.105880 Transcript_40046/m.105880 type:complete len:89 (-) Transcript_40046:83-349(-)
MHLNCPNRASNDFWHLPTLRSGWLLRKFLHWPASAKSQHAGIPKDAAVEQPRLFAPILKSDGPAMRSQRLKVFVALTTTVGRLTVPAK